jgi:hypothetical protein
MALGAPNEARNTLAAEGFEVVGQEQVLNPF